MYVDNTLPLFQFVLQNLSPAYQQPLLEYWDDRLQAVAEVPEGHFVLGRPSEHPLDPLDMLVDGVAAQALGDEGLPDRLEGQRAEGAGLRLAVHWFSGRRATRMAAVSLVIRPSLR